jgi:hypothetical protein
MYTVFAEMEMGVEKFTCCHPEEVSFVKVALPSNVPVVDQRWATWVPVFIAAL